MLLLTANSVEALNNILKFRIINGYLTVFKLRDNVEQSGFKNEIL